jgi:hypothetical protein
MLHITPTISSRISPVSIDRLMAYENGDMGDVEVIDLFQEMIDTGLIYNLQGSYGRTAQQLIDAGFCFA